MTLPSEIKAFKLLRNANITKEEKLLVLTGMNYDNKKTLYEEAKKSLKQFKGETESSSTSSATFRRNDEVSRVEETEKKTGDVGDLQEEEQELENFHGQSTGDEELEEDTSILNQDLESANQATEIGRIFIL